MRTHRRVFPSSQSIKLLHEVDDLNPIPSHSSLPCHPEHRPSMTDSVPTVTEFTALLQQHIPDPGQLSGSDLEVLEMWESDETSQRLMRKMGLDTSNLDPEGLRKHNLLTAWAIVCDKACAAVPNASTPPASEGLESEGSGCSTRTEGATCTSGEDSDVEEALALEEQGFGDSFEALTQNTGKLDNA
jgi:hypothetical protein